MVDYLFLLANWLFLGIMGAIEYVGCGHWPKE